MMKSLLAFGLVAVIALAFAAYDAHTAYTARQYQYEGYIDFMTRAEVPRAQRLIDERAALNAMAAFYSTDPDGAYYENEVYLRLGYYWRETGDTLRFDTVWDFLSADAEPDGTPRRYDNGRHPDVRRFVEWMALYGDGFESYRNELYAIGRAYEAEHPQTNWFEDWRPTAFRAVPLAAWEAVVRKDLDPNYEITLPPMQ